MPALAGSVLLGRAFGLWAFAAVAALALVTVEGSEFGADGGGVIVLLAGYAALIMFSYGLTRQTIAARRLPPSSSSAWPSEARVSGSPGTSDGRLGRRAASRRRRGRAGRARRASGARSSPPSWSQWPSRCRGKARPAA